MRGLKIGLGVAAAAVAALPALASHPASKATSPSALAELQVSPAAAANLKARLVPPAAGVILAQGQPKFLDVNQGPSFVSSAKGSFNESNRGKPGPKSQFGAKPNVKKNYQRFQK